MTTSERPAPLPQQTNEMKIKRGRDYLFFVFGGKRDQLLETLGALGLNDEGVLHQLCCCRPLVRLLVQAGLDERVELFRPVKCISIHHRILSNSSILIQEEGTRKETKKRKNAYHFFGSFRVGGFFF